MLIGESTDQSFPAKAGDIVMVEEAPSGSTDDPAYTWVSFDGVIGCVPTDRLGEVEVCAFDFRLLIFLFFFSSISLQPVHSSHSPSSLSLSIYIYTLPLFDLYFNSPSSSLLCHVLVFILHLCTLQTSNEISLVTKNNIAENTNHPPIAKGVVLKLLGFDDKTNLIVEYRGETNVAVPAGSVIVKQVSTLSLLFLMFLRFLLFRHPSVLHLWN